MTTALTVSNALTFTSTGLEVPEGYIPTPEEWLQAGLSFRQFVSTVDASVAFNWGDWLNLGEQVLGEIYAQGLEVVLPLNPDDLTYQRAEKTIYQYRRLARETPRWMRGLPGLSARHYLDAIRIRDLDARYEHLVQASVNGWSVRKAYGQLPPPDGDLLPLPPTRDDVNFELTVTNHRLEKQLATQQAMMDEASSNIEQARDILSHVVAELPVEQAEQVQQALNYLRPVIEQPEFTEFVDLAGCAIDLWEQGRVLEMGDVMDKLKDLRRELVWGRLSARADDTITINGRVEDRREWLEDHVPAPPAGSSRKQVR